MRRGVDPCLCNENAKAHEVRAQSVIDTDTRKPQRELPEPARDERGMLIGKRAGHTGTNGRGPGMPCPGMQAAFGLINRQESR